MLVVCGLTLAVEAASFLQLVVVILDALLDHESVKELAQSVERLVIITKAEDLNTCIWLSSGTSWCKARGYLPSYLYYMCQ